LLIKLLCLLLIVPAWSQIRPQELSGEERQNIILELQSALPRFVLPELIIDRDLVLPTSGTLFTKKIIFRGRGSIVIPDDAGRRGQYFVIAAKEIIL
jgi:hypothetical protein